MAIQVTQHSNLPFEICTLDGLYSDEELRAFLTYVVEADAANRQFTSADFKNGKVILPEWSRMMFERILPHLPERYIDRLGRPWTPDRAPKHVMYARMDSGQRFHVHTDTGCVYDPEENAYSKFTVLTYLNDDFEGGCTQFYNYDLYETVKVQPRANRTLVFDIDLFHAGTPVASGSKFWIGTELVCSRGPEV